MTTGYLADDERYAAAIAALGAGPARTRRFLEGYDPPDAWEALARGRHPGDPDRAYQTKVRPSLVGTVEESCARTGVAVHILGRSGYPAALEDDHEAPGVLFTLGDPRLADTRPRAVIVGTRSATPYGLGVACELGRGLAEAGVAVVSGMARGIDSAVHAGAVAATDGGPPVGVIGAALDAPVHRADAQLQAAVATKGAVFSERAPGSAGTPAWCFVVRNRVMAAMAHVVVIVECHRKGGSLHTVKAATERGTTLAAVPGSVRSSASAGCNALLVDGATPVRDVQDVLAAIELAIVGCHGILPPGSSTRVPGKDERRAVAPSPTAARVLQALDQDPASLDSVVRRAGLPLVDVAEALEQLEAAALVTGRSGWWSR
jgi:DNA processing protein